MTTLNTMLSNRATAGARYAAAVTELRAAMVDLWGIDLCLKNRGVGSGDSITTFNGEFTSFPVSLRHPTYGPSSDLGGIYYEAAAAGDTYLAALKAG